MRMENEEKKRERERNNNSSDASGAVTHGRKKNDLQFRPRSARQNFLQVTAHVLV